MNIRGITQRNVKLRKFSFSNGKAMRTRGSNTLKFGSESHERVRKKISNKTAAVLTTSTVDLAECDK